jgi:hypothetical protein
LQATAVEEIQIRTHRNSTAIVLKDLRMTTYIYLLTAINEGNEATFNTLFNSHPISLFR